MFKKQFLIFFVLFCSLVLGAQARNQPKPPYIWIDTTDIKDGHGSNDQYYSFTVYLKNGSQCTSRRKGTSSNGPSRSRLFMLSCNNPSFQNAIKTPNAVDRIKFEGSSNGVFIGRAVLATTARDYVVFPHYRWVDDEADDRTLTRTLYPENDPRITKYSIRVNTGSVAKAGTDSNIRVDLISANDESKSLYSVQLDDKSDNFERGASEVFNIYAPTLGELSYVCLSFDGAGEHSGWYPSKLVVTDTRTNKSYIKNLNYWFEVGKSCFPMN